MTKREFLKKEIFEATARLAKLKQELWLEQCDEHNIHNGDLVMDTRYPGVLFKVTRISFEDRKPSIYGAKQLKNGKWCRREYNLWSSGWRKVFVAE